MWPAREELTYARCLAGSRGTFIKGLDVRPKSRVRKSFADTKIKHIKLSMEPMYKQEGEFFETESDVFHDRCKEHVKRFMVLRSKNSRSSGKH